MKMCVVKRQLAKLAHFSICLFFAFAASNLAAQSVTVFGANESARTCMTGAEMAAKLRVSARTELEACSYALQHGNLNRHDRTATYVNRGVIKAALELHQEAFEDYQTAIDMMPDLPEPYIGRGNVFFVSDRLDDAIQDYNKAMDLQLGRMHIAFLNRGMAYEAQGHLDQAEADYRKAVELVPEWSLAQQKLERIVAKRQGKVPKPG